MSGDAFITWAFRKRIELDVGPYPLFVLRPIVLAVLGVANLDKPPDDVVWQVDRDVNARLQVAAVPVGHVDTVVVAHASCCVRWNRVIRQICGGRDLTDDCEIREVPMAAGGSGEAVPAADFHNSVIAATRFVVARQ